MDITATYSHFCEVLLKFFSHAFGQGGHENALVKLGTFLNLFKQIVHLIFGRTYFYLRIKQSGRTYHLFHDKALRLLKFVICRSRADKYLLSGYFLEFLEFQRTVVRCRRQTESIIHQHGFARVVTSVHCPDLRQCHVTLINEGDEILWEIVDQTEWPHAFAATVKIS